VTLPPNEKPAAVDERKLEVALVSVLEFALVLVLVALLLVLLTLLPLLLLMLAWLELGVVRASLSPVLPPQAVSSNAVDNAKLSIIGFMERSLIYIFVRIYSNSWSIIGSWRDFQQI